MTAFIIFHREERERRESREREREERGPKTNTEDLNEPFECLVIGTT